MAGEPDYCLKCGGSGRETADRTCRACKGSGTTRPQK